MFKKIIVATVIILFLLSAILYLQKGANAAGSAKIIFIQGKVLVMKSATTAWLEAKRDQTLNDKDKIKTLENSRAEIALDESLKNIVKIAPLTEITILTLKPKEIELPKGKVLSLLGKLEPGSKFEVRTPTAVAGVSGSGLGVETDGTMTTVGALENNVYVQGIDPQGNLMPPVNIDEGYKRIVERFMAPGNPVMLTDTERQEWLQWREDLTDRIEKQTGGASEGATAGTVEDISRIEGQKEQTDLERKEDTFESRETQKRDAAESTPSGTYNPY